MPEQTLLFDLHPLGSEPPIAHRAITPGCLLPIPANQTIDVARACSILGCGRPAVGKLIKLGSISAYRASEKAKEPWRVSYSSIVDFCDSLRLQYAIADRRRKLTPGRRWRDDELLPFPISDTVSAQDVSNGLEITKSVALKFIEEGRFDAYRLIPNSTSTWRISKTSLFAYADRLKADLAARTRPRNARM